MEKAHGGMLSISQDFVPIARSSSGPIRSDWIALYAERGQLYHLHDSDLRDDSSGMASIHGFRAS